MKSPIPTREPHTQWLSEKQAQPWCPPDSRRGGSAGDHPAVALHIPQLLLQPGVLLLLLQQFPLHGAQLLLGLTLDVIGHHHRGLQIRLEPPPFLGILLKIPEPTSVSDTCQGWCLGRDPRVSMLVTKKECQQCLVRPCFHSGSLLGKGTGGNYTFRLWEFSILTPTDCFDFTSWQQEFTVPGPTMPWKCSKKKQDRESDPDLRGGNIEEDGGEGSRPHLTFICLVRVFSCLSRSDFCSSSLITLPRNK